MSYYGPWPVGSTAIEWKFSTTVNGVPTTLAGTPAISIYKNSTTESTSGVTLNVDYDNRTGLNQVVIDTSSSGAFYAAGEFFTAVITTGTLGGLSQVGVEVGSFSLTTQQTNLNAATNTIARGTVTSGSSTTSVTTSAFTIANATLTAVSAQYAGRTMLFDGNTTTVGLRGAASTISANTNSATPTFTVATLPATPASGDLFSIL